jgi:DNA-binding response OmpR family regulator
MPSVLLIEDDTDVRLVFVEILYDAGYEVDAVPSFALGDAILDSRDYDLLITDARLPDGTGTALADSARERGIPALIVTGNAFDKGIDPTKYAVLTKPIQTHLLLATISKLLGGG